MASQFSTGRRTEILSRQQRSQAQDQQVTQQANKSKQANEAIKNVLNVAGEFSKAFQAGQSNMTAEQFSEQINNIINNAARTSELATQSGLQVTSPDVIESLRAQLLSTATAGQVAVSEGAAKGTGLAAEAQAVSQVGDVPLVEAQTARGLRPAGPSTVVNIDTANKIAAALSTQVANITSESRNAALGAADQRESANRIQDAINSGKVIVGPGADVRTALTQLGSVLGITGKDSEEVLANTRSMIKSLAELTLAGRKALKGQGQISDKETELLAKAVSAEASEITIPELQIIIDVTNRLADKSHELHLITLRKLRNKEKTKEVADFFDVPGLAQIVPRTEQVQQPTEQPPQTGGFEFIGFEQ